MTNLLGKGLELEVLKLLQLCLDSTSSHGSAPPLNVPVQLPGSGRPRELALCAQSTLGVVVPPSDGSREGRAAGCGAECWWGGPGWRQEGAPRYGLASPPSSPHSGCPRRVWPCSGACTRRRPGLSRSFPSWWSRRYSGRRRTGLGAWAGGTAALTLTSIFLLQGRGERAYDIYSRLLRERIVCVMGPVSTQHADLPCSCPDPRRPLSSNPIDSLTSPI